MQKYIEILKTCPLFFDISKADIPAMLDCLDAHVSEFDKKYTIFGEGNPAKYIGIMLSGSAQIISVDYYGNRSILSEITAPDVFGEAFACSKTESLPVSITANEPCEVMFIDSGRLLCACSKGCAFHQQLIFNLMRDLASKVLQFHQKIEITGKRTTRDKLMTYLMIQAKNAGSGSFDIPFNRQELADYLEVDRSGLSAEISKLRADGVLKSTKNHFTLL